MTERRADAPQGPGSGVPDNGPSRRIVPIPRRYIYENEDYDVGDLEEEHMMVETAAAAAVFCFRQNSPAPILDLLLNPDAAPRGPRPGPNPVQEAAPANQQHQESAPAYQGAASADQQHLYEGAEEANNEDLPAPQDGK